MNFRSTGLFGVVLFMLILFVFVYQNRLSLSEEIYELKKTLRDIESYNHFLHTKSPPLLPSTSTKEKDEKKFDNRGLYRGKGDKNYLVGFIEKD